MNNKYKLGEDDKMELFQHFFEKMIDFDYTPYYIGSELAYISRAMEFAEDEGASDE